MIALVHHLLTTTAARDPLKEAVVDGSRRFSYADIETRSNRLAGALRAAGLRRGDRVGVFLGKTAEEVVSIFGVLKAGGVVVPINHMLFPEQVRHILNDCQVSVLITSRAALARLDAVLPEARSVGLIVTTDRGAPGDLDRRQTSFDEIDQTTPDEAPGDMGISQDLAAILYTSGSTGLPKGVMLSHANLLAGSRIVSTYLEISERERILSILPFSFDYGLNQLLTAFQQGGTIVLLTFRFPDEIVRALLAERITGLAGVPPLWSLLATPNSSLHRHRFPDLRYITNSGGTMPLSVLGSLRTTLHTTRVYLMYGLTEAFRSTYLPPEELDRRPTSMGRAIPDCECFVLNEDGTACKPGEVGELVHRGPTVSLGYWGQPETTAKVLRPNPLLPEDRRDTERVCYSGDLVVADEDGFFYFVGRRDAAIKTSGYRISATEVEQVLYASGLVREAAVIGVPDEVLGQSIKAFVVPHDGQTVDGDALLVFCAEKMPRYMLPKEIEVPASLPKTSSGKIDYPAIRRGQGSAGAGEPR